MPQTAQKPETLSRSGAIDILRDELIKLAGDEASICKVAAEKNIFCRGLHRFSDVELRHRFDWINAKNPRMPRAEMEAVVDRWQLARQEVDNLPTACDVPRIEIHHLETVPLDDDVNFRGVGEGGMVVSPPTLCNAIEDALAPLGVRIREQHLPPSRLLELIEEASWS